MFYWFRMMRNNFLVAIFWLGCLFLFTTNSYSATLTEQRESFLKAESLLKKGREADFLTQMNGLKDYAMYPYLQYRWLKNNLNKEKEIKVFLSTYKDSRYAEILRDKWLAAAAKQGQWQKVVEFYEPSRKTAAQCYYHLARYKTGEKQAALAEAKALWLKPRSQPPACNGLFAVFKKSSLFSQDLVWQRFLAALDKGKKKNLRLAGYLVKQMSSANKKRAQLCLKIRQMSRKKLNSAIKKWESEKHNFKNDTDTTDFVEKRLGLVLAYRGQPSSSYKYLSKLTNPDAEARKWRVRSALRIQDWQKVVASLNNLSTEEKQEEKWRYWQARASEQTGEKTKAKALFTELAKERSYYGFASADKMKTAYQLNDNPIVVDAKAVDKLKQKAEFKMVKELFALGRKKQAKWDWWFTVKRLDIEGIKAASKLAQGWGMTQTAVFTIAKAKYWDDMDLRFPILFKEQIHAQAKKQNLEPAMVFGLIRQESVFDELAGSHVGARGLMQIMPATGRVIARELGEKWRSASVLYDPETNLRYGTYYYKQQLDRFDGQLALAAAGYNAGPHRVTKWRPSKPMAMDIWIETIPFDETRKYVSIVLANVLIYQQRLKRGNLKMKDFLSKVQPS